MLAEPNLTAISVSRRKFLAGDKYPLPVVDSLGQVSVVYKEYGIGLAFTRVVMSEGRISLKRKSILPRKNSCTSRSWPVIALSMFMVSAPCRSIHWLFNKGALLCVHHQGL